MSQLEVLIFFDESGKGNDRPTLMGGIMIPSSVYDRPDILAVMGTELHWTQYTGDRAMKSRIKSFLDTMLKYESTYRLNIINYNQSMIEEKQKLFLDEKFLAQRTIYAKFPERIMYGLLRKYGHYAELKARLIIENSSEYSTQHLDRLLKKQLNEQSIYRGESYDVLHCDLVGKGVHAGLEFTDLILGIVRTIIKNANSTSSRSQSQKVELVLELLQDQRLHSLLTQRARYFEWSHASELRKIDLENYIHIFKSTHHQHVFL